MENVAADRLQQAATYIEAEEGATNRYRGALAGLATVLLVAMSLFHLYAAIAIVPAQILRPVHVGWTLLLVFLLFPIAARYRNQLMWWDVVCAALGVATIVYLLAGGDDFWDRNTLPNRADVFFGVAFVLLVLEAVRRTSGSILLFVISLFLAYGFLGPWLPDQWAHRGYDVSSLSGSCTRPSKAFGTAVDVVVAHHPVHDLRRFLQQSEPESSTGLELRCDGKRTGAGRTVVLASFLLGGLARASRPRSRRLGRLPDARARGLRQGRGGGPLAAGGWADHPPPVLGRRISSPRLLKISYLDVLLMATVRRCSTTCRFSWSNSTRANSMPNVAVAVEGQFALLTKRYWYHSSRWLRSSRLDSASSSRTGDRRHVRGVVPAGTCDGWRGSLRCATARARCECRRYVRAAVYIIVGVVAKTGSARSARSSSPMRAAACSSRRSSPR
jgi:hypothetical protein